MSGLNTYARASAVCLESTLFIRGSTVLKSISLWIVCALAFLAIGAGCGNAETKDDKPKAKPVEDKIVTALKGEWSVKLDIGEIPQERGLSGTLTVAKVTKEKEGYKLSGTYENQKDGKKYIGEFAGTFNGGWMEIELQQLKPSKGKLQATVAFPMTKDGSLIPEGIGRWNVEGKKAFQAYFLTKKHELPEKEANADVVKFLKANTGWKGTTDVGGLAFNKNRPTTMKIAELDGEKNAAKFELEIDTGGAKKEFTVTGAFTGTRFSGEFKDGRFTCPMTLIFYKEGKAWKAMGTWTQKQAFLGDFKRVIMLEVSK